TTHDSRLPRSARVKVSSTELPSRQVALDIEVEQERLDRAIDEAYRRLSARVDVPGFRRGKAPRPMVERLIGRDRIVEEALDQLVPDVVTEAIQQEKVEAYTRPRVETIELDPSTRTEGTGLRLKAVVGLAPKVEVGDDRGDQCVASEQASVTGEQSDGVIEGPRHADPEKRFAGRPAHFNVTLHWVKERELPALDDEFAQQVGDYSDVAGLRAGIESQLRAREEERVREQLEEAAMSQLVEISSIEFPPQLVEHQAQHMLETFTRNVEQQGLQLPQYLRLVGKEQATFEEEIRSGAESRGRRSWALEAFADAEQIGVEQQEVEDEVRRVAAGAAEADAVERLAMTNPATLQRVQEVARERKAMARLLELATAPSRNGGPQPRKNREKTA